MESVLRRAIQVEDLLFNGSHAIEHGGRQRFVLLYSSLQIIKLIDLWKKEHFSVRCPEQDNLFGTSFHISDVAPDLFDELAVRSSHHIVSSAGLICGNVIWVEGCRERHDLLQITSELLKQRGLKNFGAQCSLVEVSRIDVPTANFKINGVDHGNQLLDRLVHILDRTAFLIEAVAAMSCRALREGSIKVCLLLTIFSQPRKLVAIRNDSCGEGGAIVATETNEHDANTRHAPVRLDRLGLQDRLR